MKTWLLIFIIYILQELVISQEDALDRAKNFVKAYHKKFNGSLHRNKEIINYRRYLKLKPVNLSKLSTKKHLGYKNYTVFPPVRPHEKQSHNVPDSPYFPLDQNYNQKIRVKKVLPDYNWSVTRRKRSVAVIKEHEVAPKEIKKDSTKSKAPAKTIKKEASVKKGATTVQGKKSNPEDKKFVRSSKKKRIRKKRNKRKQLRKRKKNKKNKNKKKGYGRTGTNAGKNKKQQNKPQKALKYTPKDPKKKTKKPPSSGREPQVAISETEKKSLPHPPKGSKASPKRKAKPSRRLIASKDALIEDYPYVVSIQKDHEHWCAGALLNPRLVITTANCVWKSNRISRLRVRAGSRDVEQGGQMSKIQEVMKHPRWSIRKYPDNDVALLLLEKQIRFSDKVHAVDLPNRVMMPPFEDAWVTSWGAERRDGVFQQKGLTLQVYYTRIMDRDKCNNITQRFGVSVTENFICLSQTGKHAPCTRDTGAPAVSDGVIWGLASWGIRKLCGTERFPAMFSYLASQSNLNFIINATHFLMSEERNSPFLDRIPFAHFRNNKVQNTTATPAMNLK